MYTKGVNYVMVLVSFVSPKLTTLLVLWCGLAGVKITQLLSVKHKHIDKRIHKSTKNAICNQNLTYIYSSISCPSYWTAFSTGAHMMLSWNLARYCGNAHWFTTTRSWVCGTFWSILIFSVIRASTRVITTCHHATELLWRHMNVMVSHITNN